MDLRPRPVKCAPGSKRTCEHNEESKVSGQQGGGALGVKCGRPGELCEARLRVEPMALYSAPGCKCATFRQGRTMAWRQGIDQKHAFMQPCCGAGIHT
eukprot:scaffold220555_cov22-Tisochrysis_lutea.AAC.1